MERGKSAAATHVRSADGTPIAVWSSGSGPPLVLVHGASADSTRWRPLLPHLEGQVTVHAIDRRGRGGSGDGPEYQLEREFEDVAAVVDAVAEQSGTFVDVYGHSFGGLCAFGAAGLTDRVRRLVLYEGWPSVDPQAQAASPGVLERIEAALAEGNRDAAVEVVFRELLGMRQEELDAVRALPSWPGRVAAAHTLPRELRALQEERLDPAGAAKVTVPTLLVTGSNSADPSRKDVAALRGALPDAREVVLHNQGHVADIAAPELIAKEILAFLSASDDAGRQGSAG